MDADEPAENNGPYGAGSGANRTDLSGASVPTPANGRFLNMAEKEQEKPPEGENEQKIIADDDWKAQARAEKEKLAEDVEKGQGPAGAEGAAEGGEPGPRDLPPASFSTLVTTLATQAMLALGGMVDRKTKRRIVDMDLAKHHIDSLAVLEEKTKGNLTDDERKLLDQALYESRMHYVQMAQRVTGGGEPPAEP